MAARRPLVIVSGVAQEMPTADGLPIITHGGGPLPVTIIATSDSSATTNDTTVNDDAVLQFSVTSGKLYHINVRAAFDSSSNADFRWDCTGPATPTLLRGVSRFAQSSTGAYSGEVAFTVYPGNIDIALAAGSSWVWAEMDVILVPSSTGTFKIRWCQATSHADQVIRKRGSYLQYLEV